MAAFWRNTDLNTVPLAKHATGVMAATSSDAASTGTTVLTYPILGTRRPSNFILAAIVAIGGTGFLLAGLSSLLSVNLLPFVTLPEIQFIPQGIALMFYGVAGVLLEAYLLYAIALDVGSGFNEFNRSTGKVRIFRRGYPGKYRIVDLEYDLEDVLAVRAEIRNGLNPKRLLYLRVKGRGDIPLNEVGQPMALSELEDRAAELARFLSVPLEGI